MSAFRESLALLWYFLMINFCLARGKVLFMFFNYKESLRTKQWLPIFLTSLFCFFEAFPAVTLSLQSLHGFMWQSWIIQTQGEMMKEWEFEFDDDIFGESNCKDSKVEEAYKPKQCDLEVCLIWLMPQVTKYKVLCTTWMNRQWVFGLICIDFSPRKKTIAKRLELH